MFEKEDPVIEIAICACICDLGFGPSQTLRKHPQHLRLKQVDLSSYEISLYSKGSANMNRKVYYTYLNDGIKLLSAANDFIFMEIGFYPISVRITKFWLQDREDSVRTMIILATAYLYLHLPILSCNITNYYLIIELLMMGCLSIPFFYLCIFKCAFCMCTASYTWIMLFLL